MILQKIKEKLKDKKIIAGILAGTLGATLLAYATLPLNDGDYNSELSRHSWDANEYGNNNPRGYVPTGLGVNETWVLPVSGKGDDWPLGAIRYLEKRPGYDTPEAYNKFDGQYIYCVANHVPNYTLSRGMQAFGMKRWDTITPFDACVGTGDVKNFNFLMLAIACNYGTENSDYRPDSLDNAYYGIASQAIAWVTTASPAEQAFGIIKGENFAEDLAAFRNQPIYRAVMNNSFPKSTHPSIYRQLHAPATGWQATDGCQNWFEAVFADVWNTAQLTSKMNIDWEAEKSTLTGQVESGDDGFYHMYLNVFQNEAMKTYLTGISFAPEGDWTLVEQTAEGIMHFKSPSGEMPESGSIGKLYWPNGFLGGIMPKDLSSAKLYTFTFYSPGNDGKYGFGKTQTHFGSVIDKDLEVYITTGTEPETGDFKMERFKHTEEFTATYNVNLRKFDSETGKPLEGAHFDILESFDDSQLDNTVLEDDNWANDSGSQFERWDDPEDDPCDRDDNVTGSDGQLYEIYSNGSASSTKAHTDVRNYTYEKGYCGGHPVPEFIEIPEPEEDEETGEITNEDEIEEAKEENDRLLAAYMSEIQRCRDLEAEGGFFCHSDEYDIDINASGGYDSKEEYEAECNNNTPIPDAMKELEDDRDIHYQDFISLRYEYGAKEIAAPKGYILHGTHTDDIPIEVRVVTSSEYKDTDMATNIGHSAGGSVDNPDEGDYDDADYAFYERDTYESDEINFIDDTEETDFYTIKKTSMRVASPSNAEDFIFEDEEQTLEDADIASPSEAKEKTTVVETGYTAKEKAAAFGLARGTVRDTTTFKNSKASTVTPPDSTIVDWTFIVYDHRTDGEVHINKQDFNLQEFKDYDTYAQSNGDGTLEGAVYGLFAATDIEHPDGHTGVVFKKNDLVSVATTDRNGDASFMAITESPGYIYNYDSGKIEATDWAANTPNNLHINENASANKEDDIESFSGYNPDNSEISGGNGADLTDTSGGDGTYFNKYSSNQGYEDTSTTTTTGHYPISDNEGANGNCWIGRPLIISKDGTQYYIKELSRSEGYELSVYGKDETLITNRDAFSAGGADFASGTVSVSKIEIDRDNGGNIFTVSSAETTDGYDITTSNIPDGATFYTTTTEWIWDNNVSHKESVETQEPVIAEKDSLVMADGHTWRAKLGDTVTLANGKKFQVNNAKVVDNSVICVKPSNTILIENPNLVPAADSNYIEGVRAAFVKNKFRVPSDNAPWVLVPFDELTAQSIADAINTTIFTDSYYDAFNAMTLVGTTAISNQKYAIVAYDYTNAGKEVTALYNASNDSVYVKKAATFKSNMKAYNGWIWKAYSIYENVQTNETGFVTSACVPNDVITNASFEWHKEDLGSATYKIAENESYWTYAEGEQQIDTNGELMTKTVITEDDVKPTLVPKTIDVELTDVKYENGQYTFHVDQETAENNPTINFRIKYKDDVITIDGVEHPTDLYVYTKGVISAVIPITHADSFIQSIMLTYPGQQTIVQDANTRAAAKEVLERPIRQQIKVMKDIQTNPDGSYAHDTYSAVHKENLSADGYNRWYTKVTDWLTSLMNGKSGEESTNKVDDFRFKAYLKSNLERLYRDDNGNIVWLDRNGNVLTPNYIDTNGDGNYDTFTWTRTAQDGSGGSIIDFPEKQLVKDDSLQSSNVQKIYTKVEHNTNSTTTGDNSNNTWATYNDPQTGETKNVGQFIGYTTSQDGTNGEAIRANASLYSYDGNNFNVKKTDRINEGQNTGYTRLLEMTEDSERNQVYDYKKFFDAIATANADKWDNDMFSSNKNYPGQNWFETFYEKYQMDDADPDHTLENTDGVDKDNTAGGDRDTSYKPFQWIRENIFKENGEEKDYYNGTANNPNIENTINTSTFAHENAEASDAVRQFAIDYYLQDEVGKLVQNNGQDEDEAIPIDGKMPTYADEVYDRALHNALIKAVNYLKPFYDNDLDTIYSVEWDKEMNGGMDGDYTTLNVDKTDADKGYYYGISSYLPYGTYVLVEQPPQRIDGTINDFTNKSYDTDLPKEVTLPSLYNGDQSNDTFDNFDANYFYDTTKTPEDLAKNYYIRFNEEWSDVTPGDLRNYVIRAHSNDGDYEIYKYGLNIDKLTAKITYGDKSYDYDGFSVTQESSDPLKDYYNPIHKVNGKNVTTAEGANDSSHYFADDGNDAVETANGSHYAKDAIEERYHYGSISEHSGEINGFRTMTGIQTAYEGRYASMLVPWTVVTPVDLDSYKVEDFSGFADVGFHNTFYKVKLRVEKLDSETGENILHDGAIFGLYAASRYTTQDEVDEAIANGAPETTKIGNAKHYLKDTTITGTYEFLKAMGADNIKPYTKIFGEETNQFSGTVPAGTPVCLESEQIILYDETGAKTGDMTVYTTTNDINMVDEEDESKAYHDQNTGYFITPQPIGAGVYVLAELKPPIGYSRTKPIAIEIYSDAVTYYMNGNMHSRVEATIYK